MLWFQFLCRKGIVPFTEVQNSSFIFRRSTNKKSSYAKTMKPKICFKNNEYCRILFLTSSLIPEGYVYYVHKWSMNRQPKVTTAPSLWDFLQSSRSSGPRSRTLEQIIASSEVLPSCASGAPIPTQPR